MIKNPPASAGDSGDMGSVPGLGISPGEGMATRSNSLAGESHGERSLVGYSPVGHKGVRHDLALNRNKYFAW